MSIFNEAYEDEIYNLKSRIQFLETENRQLQNRLRALDPSYDKDCETIHNKVNYWDIRREY